MQKASKPKSSVIYSGHSLIDGSPIVVIAITTSGNTKTGNMVQTHILRSDIDPREASKTGADFAICGNCQHRGKSTDNPKKKLAENRTCYVNLAQGPTIVYKAYKAGKYPTATPEQTRSIGNARMVRLGTYGDPAAVPRKVWDDLLAESEGHTGYTHQPELTPDYSRLMASADTPEQGRTYNAQGIRTFRVIPVNAWKEHGKAALNSTEILCPASKETGAKVTCQQCKLCSGSSTKAKSIAIVAHGTSRNMVKG